MLNKTLHTHTHTHTHTHMFYGLAAFNYLLVSFSGAGGVDYHHTGPPPPSSSSTSIQRPVVHLLRGSRLRFTDCCNILDANMSGGNGDQLHRSTLGIYSSLTDEFNPSLQKLVSLGNSYIQAFQALAVCSEAYFNALSRIGEKAFYTKSSRSLGDVLIQISETQQRLTSELKGVFNWFNVEVLQMMDNNVRLDKDYISESRLKYEMEVHNQAAAQELQWRRGTSQDSGEYVQFLRVSHLEALSEEERRYRFLAEKHSGLIQSIARLMNKRSSRSWLCVRRGPKPDSDMETWKTQSWPSLCSGVYILMLPSCDSTETTHRAALQLIFGSIYGCHEVSVVSITGVFRR
uniref:BAR/IMD domain containing adaptor protein 2 like 2a n=1 Tax=Nothobranchius furzeri TaxID=105023 RepID=A0A8C6KIS2_NOTFU